MMMGGGATKVGGGGGGGGGTGGGVGATSGGGATTTGAAQPGAKKNPSPSEATWESRKAAAARDLGALGMGLFESKWRPFLGCGGDYALSFADPSRRCNGVSGSGPGRQKQRSAFRDSMEPCCATV